MGLEQCSSKAPHQVELLGAPQGEKGKRPRAYGLYSVLSTQSSVLLFLSTQYAARLHSIFPFPLSSRLFPLLLPHHATPVDAGRDWFRFRDAGTYSPAL